MKKGRAIRIREVGGPEVLEVAEFFVREPAPSDFEKHEAWFDGVRIDLEEPSTAKQYLIIPALLKAAHKREYISTRKLGGSIQESDLEHVAHGVKALSKQLPPDLYIVYKDGVGYAPIVTGDRLPSHWTRVLPRVSLTGIDIDRSGDIWWDGFRVPIQKHVAVANQELPIYFKLLSVLYSLGAHEKIVSRHDIAAEYFPGEPWVSSKIPGGTGEQVRTALRALQDHLHDGVISVSSEMGQGLRLWIPRSGQRGFRRTNSYPRCAGVQDTKS